MPRLRRILGVYAFLYSGVHFIVFVGVDYGFHLPSIQEGLIEKRYALAGLSALLLLAPLDLISTSGWRRRLGRTWTRVHRDVYPAALWAVVHYYWGVKVDTRPPLLYGAVALALLVLQLPFLGRALRSRRKEQAVE